MEFDTTALSAETVQPNLEILVFNTVEVVEIEVPILGDEKMGLKQCLLLMGWEVLLRKLRELQYCNVAMVDGWMDSTLSTFLFDYYLIS